MAVCRDLVEVGFDTASAKVLGFDTATTRADINPTITPLAPMTLVSSTVIRQPSWQYAGDGLIYYQGHIQVELGEKLCDYCPCTEYGDCSSECITPNGYSSCEGSHCDVAYDNYLDEQEATLNIIKYALKVKRVK